MGGWPSVVSVAMCLEERVNTLRVGIAGAGGIAHQHAIGWRDNAPRGELVALADISPERAQIISDQYTGGKAKVYDTLDAMIADPDVDAIDICLPHDLHADAIIKAAKAGEIILCEKPLCTTQADAARIGAALKESGATFMMAHNNLFQPSLLEARKLLQLNTIGKTFVVRSIECFQNSGALLGIPSLVWWTVIAILIGHIVYRETRFGAHVLATGDNNRAASVSGISVPRIRLAVMRLSGGLAALAGLLAQEAAFVEEQPVAARVDLVGIDRVVADQRLHLVEPGDAHCGDGLCTGVDQIGLHVCERQ